jgi:hypothetical protein
MTSPHPSELQPVHGVIPATAPRVVGPGRLPSGWINGIKRLPVTYRPLK